MIGSGAEDRSEPCDAVALRDRIRLSPVAQAAICLTSGAILGSAFPVNLMPFILLSGVWGLSGLLFAARNSAFRLWSFRIALVLIGVCRFQWTEADYRESTLVELIRPDDQVQLVGRIASLPIVTVRIDSPYSPRSFGNPIGTRFDLQVDAVVIGSQTVASSGRCQVFLKGDATSVLSSGSTVNLTGTFSWPEAPGNPGEFSYAQLLQEQHIAGSVFVEHPDAIRTVRSGFRASPVALTERLRRESRRAIVRSVHPDVVGLGLAMLLGNRSQISSDVEDAFVASGTMHLMAISGLHVGIMYWFLLRVMHCLLVRRNHALAVAAILCIGYAMMTDWRPSVVRATTFCCLFSASQIYGRETSVFDVISSTVLLMLISEPSVVHSTAAWLSFLSVFALALVSSRSGEAESSALPSISSGFAERFRELSKTFVRVLVHRYRQMLMILAFTTPLVLATFHTLSPVGLVVNAFLIPYAGVVLATGFLTMSSGVIAPALAWFPGSVFSLTLEGLLRVVRFAAEAPFGHTYVPDLSEWFLPVYYASLLAVLVLRRSGLPVSVWLIPGAILIAGILGPERSRNPGSSTCAVLSVGRGNAVVVETMDGQVYLIDAGAMNQGDRVADQVCSYLWRIGKTKLDGIVLTHADLDHYNAVARIMRRISVRQLLTSSRVLDSDSESLRALMDYANASGVPVSIVSSGDQLAWSEFDITFLQSPTKTGSSDIRPSLSVVIQRGACRMLVPSDTDGTGPAGLWRTVGKVDILVSPHHGAKAANTLDVADMLQPKYVIVSARNTKSRPHLEKTYAAAREVLFTSESGAVTVGWNSEGKEEVSTFHSR